MAGNYPDPIGYRIPYHLDGTVMYRLGDFGGTIESKRAQSDIDVMNDDDGTTGHSLGHAGDNSYYLGLLFPRKIDIDGLFVAAKNHQQWEYSQDTTNLVDGVWESLVDPPEGQLHGPLARTGVTGQGAFGVNGIRWRPIESGGNQSALSELHIYGEPSAGEDPDRLEIWKPSTDEKMDPNHFEWGDVPQGSSAQKTFRVKNLSAINTYEDIIVSMLVPNDPTPSIDASHTFSIGGGSFLTQINIGNLAPGGTSAEITMQQDLQADAALSLYWGIIRAVHTSIS